jgi:hypothetical protein
MVAYTNITDIMSLPVEIYELLVNIVQKHSLQGIAINLCAHNIHTDFHGAEKAEKNNI